MYVRKRKRRAVEGRLRAKGVVIVEEWGARIHESQFEKEKEADPNAAGLSLHVDCGLCSCPWEHEHDLADCEVR